MVYIRPETRVIDWPSKRLLQILQSTFEKYKWIRNEAKIQKKTNVIFSVSEVIEVGRAGTHTVY